MLHYFQGMVKGALWQWYEKNPVFFWKLNVFAKRHDKIVGLDRPRRRLSNSYDHENIVHENKKKKKENERERLNLIDENDIIN